MRKLPVYAFIVLSCAVLVLLAQAQITSAQDAESASESLIKSVMNCPDGCQGNDDESQIGQLPATSTPAGAANSKRDHDPGLLQLAILLGLAGTAAIGLRPRHRKERSADQ
ncbi:MAG TPA: hypothetical protein VFL82_05750 [Thermomicrobiales bacterium]|nr:hypothetical protein [Thermomicrobiales bacterium]